MFGKKKDKDASGAAAPADATAKSPAAENVKGAKPAKAAKPAKTPKPAKEAKAAKAAPAVKAAKEPKAPKPAKTPKEAKVAAAPKAKGSKRKNSLAKGGPGFFAAHIEKMILVGCLAAVGYLIYSGFSTPGYDTSAVPEKLEKDAKELMTKISQDHWEQIAAEPDRKVEHDFAERAAAARLPTDPNRYENAVWDPKPLGVFEKRGDPKIFAPEQLFVTTVSGALAVEVPIDEVEPYDDLEDAEPIRPRQRNSGSRNRRGGRGGSGSDVGSMGSGGPSDFGSEDMGMGSGGMMGSMGGTGGSQKQRFLKSDYDLGVILGSANGMGGASGSMGGPAAGMMMGPGGGGMGSMGSMGTSGQPIRDGLSDKNKDRGPKFKIGSRAVLFNAITAVVPHRKMVEEYLAQFEESGSFIPQRDMPFYMTFELQRVDVTGNPLREIKEDEWKHCSDGLEHTNFPLKQKWATRPPMGRPVQEVIDRNAYAGGLTMPIPPLLVRDYRQFSKHPAVDWAWDARNPMSRRPRRTDQPQKENTLLPGVRGGSAAGGMGQEGMMGGMMGSMGSMGGMMGSMGGGRDESMGSYGGGAMGSYGGMDGGSMGGMMGSMDGGYGDDRGGSMGSMGAMGMMGSMGSMGGGMMGGGMGISAAAQPEFKMIRCYDMLNPATDYAKIFRYRIQVSMRDPNYPEDRNLPRPSPNTLSDEVWARVAPLITADDRKIKVDPQAMRTLRKTDWSQPSPPARVEIPIEVFAGDVVFDGPKAFEAEGKIYLLTVNEPTGSVVATTMDGSTGARFAVEEEVRRGSVLSEKADVDLIVPSTRIVKVKKDQAVDARATVVDIRGGKPLAGDSRDDPLKDIGEMLILNRDGSVTVTSEFDDTFLFRMYTFADEHEAAEKAGDNTTSSYGGGYGGDEGGSRGGSGGKGR